MNETTTIERNSRRRSSLLMEDDVVVEIHDDDERSGRRGFSLFRNREEEFNPDAPDMKVPFNNRYKYKHGNPNSGKNAEFEEESLIIENNLTEGKNDSKR